MGIPDFRSIFKNIEVPLSVFIILGITSFGIFVFSDRMWRNQFQRNIPLYDNLMQARKNLTKGQLLFEKLLSGDQSVKVEDAWPFFEAASLSVKDSLSGRSTIIYLTGKPPKDEELINQLQQLDTHVNKVYTLALKRWESRTSPIGISVAEERQAYYDLERNIDSLNYHILEHIGELLGNQKKVQLTTLFLWFFILTCLSTLLYITGKKHKEAEKQLKKSHDDLERQVEKRTYELTESNVFLIQEIEERKLAEELLKESEERWRSLTENSPDMISVLDRDLNVTFINKVIVEGLTPEQMIGTPIYNYVSEKKRERSKKVLKDALNSGETITVETDYQNPDGSIVYLETRAVPRTLHGERIGLTLHSMSITERKQMEKALRESEELYINVVETMRDGIFVLDKDFHFRHWNKGMEKISQVPRHELIGTDQQPWDVFPHLAEQGIDKSLRQAMAGKTARHDEITFRQPDGTKRITTDLLLPLKSPEGDIRGIVGVIHDVTESRAAEKALKKSENELRIRDQINNVFLTCTDEKIYPDVLKVILKVMESEFGVFGYFKPDGSFVTPAVTQETYWDQCNVAEKDRIFEKGMFSGIWRKAISERKTIIQNNGPFDTPEGHIHIDNTIITPIVYRDEVISAIHLTNKSTDYAEKDQEILEEIANQLAPVLYAWLQRDIEESERERAEEALRKANDELEFRVGDRTAKLTESNEFLRKEIEERLKTEEALKKSEKNLRTLSLRIFYAQEDERRRIGDELHDGIAQILGAIKIWAETAEHEITINNPMKAKKSLNRIVPLTQETIEEVRRISRNLHPAILDKIGILAAIDSLIEEFKLIHEHVKVITELNIDESDVPESLSVVIYRVLQEALNNVSKHSLASLVRLSLNKSITGLELVINDNGLGFDTGKASSSRSGRGLGLTSMEERVTLTGGNLVCESNMGNGTTLKASWILSETN